VSVDQDEFRLTDTEGVGAPRSRSWRTGFLKKRSAPVALVEPPDRLALQTHVGRRVAATGLLTSHDLKVSALRVVGASCN
jgi:nicotinamidase-related amidase